MLTSACLTRARELAEPRPSHRSFPSPHRRQRPSCPAPSTATSTTVCAPQSRPQPLSLLSTDLYGDNEETREEGSTQQDTSEPAAEQKPAPRQEPKREEKPVAAPKDASLPPKPSAELSYSAQVAKQFSAYKQTPAQERQPYQVSPAPKANGSAAGDAGSSSNDDNGRRAVRPSEMKDEG